MRDQDVQFVTAGTGAVNVLMTGIAVSVPGAESPSAPKEGGHLESGGLGPGRSLDLRWRRAPRPPHL